MARPELNAGSTPLRERADYRIHRSARRGLHLRGISSPATTTCHGRRAPGRVVLGTHIPSDLPGGVREAHNLAQREYFDTVERSRLALGDTPYIRRHVDEAIAI